MTAYEVGKRDSCIVNVIPIEQPSTPLQYALAYARRGWHVLPLEPRSKRPHRLARHGVQSATDRPETIRAWWEAAPDAGVGISMGASGLCAFDVDPRNNGLLTLEQLEVRYGKIDSAITAFTPGGGMHLVYTAPPAGVSMPGSLGPGIDVKFNGYICVEPSIHPNGRQYVWEASSSPLDDISPSPLPDWIRDFVTLKPAAEAPSDRAVPITDEQWQEIAAALRVVDADDRDTWVRVGMALQSTGEGQRAFGVWDAWARSSRKYDAADQLRTWRSFKARGLSGLTYRTVFDMAQKAGWRNTAPRHEEAAETPSAGLLLDVGQLAEQSDAMTWAVKHVIPERSLGMLFGASGAFKSFIALDYALHRCYGMNWLGRKTRRGRVVYLAAEGGTGLIRRIRAWHVAHGMDWSKCPMMVCIVPLTLRTKSSHLSAQIGQACSDATDVVVDTLSQTFTGNENSADEMADYLRVLGHELRTRLSVTVLLVHHSGHSASERPRGSSAILANLDFLFGSFRDEKEMLATLCCLKQKDGDLLPDHQFSLVQQDLGHDEDGDPVTSLVAKHLSDGQEIAEKLLEEKKAGRSSHLQALLEAASDGMLEADLRHAFYASFDRTAHQDTKKKAFFRARDKAIAAGFMVIDEAAGYVVRLLKPVDNLE